MSRGRKDSHLSRAIQELPVHVPSNELWEGIAGELEQGTEQRGSRNRYWLRYAAVFALLLVSGAAWYALVLPSSDISYAVELSELTTEAVAEWDTDTDFDTFLEEECTGYREICEMPQFKNLMTELTAVKAEVTNIAYMIETTGFDEFLYKAKAKADQESIRIKKELVKLLRG